jgi:hypothetical protein
LRAWRAGAAAGVGEEGCGCRLLAGAPASGRPRIGEGDPGERTEKTRREVVVVGAVDGGVHKEIEAWMDILAGVWC